MLYLQHTSCCRRRLVRTRTTAIIKRRHLQRRQYLVSQNDHRQRQRHRHHYWFLNQKIIDRDSINKNQITAVSGSKNNVRIQPTRRYTLPPEKS
jgi:hypothetical protein